MKASRTILTLLLILSSYLGFGCTPKLTTVDIKNPNINLMPMRFACQGREKGTRRPTGGGLRQEVSNVDVVTKVTTKPFILELFTEGKLRAARYYEAPNGDYMADLSSLKYKDGMFLYGKKNQYGAMFLPSVQHQNYVNFEGKTGMGYLNITRFDKSFQRSESIIFPIICNLMNREAVAQNKHSLKMLNY